MMAEELDGFATPPAEAATTEIGERTLGALPYRPRASKVAGMSERTWMPHWSAERVTIQSAGTVQ